MTGIVSSIGEKISTRKASEDFQVDVDAAPAAKTDSSDGSPFTNPKPLGIAAAAMIAVAAIGVWVFSGSDDTPPNAEPVAADVAPANSNSGQAPDTAPSADLNPLSAGVMTSEEINLALTNAEAAILDNRSADAAAELSSVVIADPDNARLPFLMAQLSQMQLREYLENARVALQESRLDDAANELFSARSLNVANTVNIETLESDLAAAVEAQIDAERLAAENTRRADADRVAAAQAEADRVAAEKIEADRVAAAKLEADRLAAQKAEADRVAAAKLEADRLAAQKAEADRVAAEKIEAERVAAAKLEADRLAAQKAEADRLAAQQAETDRLAAQQAETDRLAAQQAETDRLAAQQVEADRLAAEQIETERLAADRRAEDELQAAAIAATAVPVAASSGSNTQANPQNSSPVGISSLTRTKYVAPKYPRVAERRNLSGWVDIVFTVAKDGTTKNIEIRNSEPGKTFIKAATRAVEKWEFMPIFENGIVVEQRAGVRMMFAIE
jgi:TonB family protein